MPTLSAYQAMADEGTTLGSPEYVRRKTEEGRVASRAAFQLARQVGVSMAVGTDCGAPGHPHGRLVEELVLMAELGAEPAETLRLGTAAGAALLGVASEVGTPEPGKRADVVGVAGDPLEDPTALRAVRFVLRDGARVPLLDES